MRSLRNALRRTAGYVAGAAMGAGAGVSFMRALDKATEAEVTKVMQRFATSVFPLLADMIQKEGRGLRDLGCADCDRFGHGYMLRDEVWASAVKEDEDGGNLLLCLACCEKRLGRAMEPVDLANVPINEPLFYAWNYWPEDDEPEDSDGSDDDPDEPSRGRAAH